MKRLCIGVLFCTLPALAVLSQTLGVKSNLIYDATGTVNAGVEYALGKTYSIGLSANYNGWTIKSSQSWRHILIQPGLRYWLKEAFNEHYIGVYGIYTDYDIRQVSFPLLGFDKQYLYKGTGYGGGVEYGYHLYLSPRVNLAFSLGIGVLSFSYEKADYEDINAKGDFTKKYFGPTELGISIVYLIK